VSLRDVRGDVVHVLYDGWIGCLVMLCASLRDTLPLRILLFG
jgi:hypothetical protein